MLHGQNPMQRKGSFLLSWERLTLREYLGKPGRFFAEHLSRYSKSRRKAPIYWPLQTSDGRFTLWIYYPRLTQDTLLPASISWTKSLVWSGGNSSSRVTTSMRRKGRDERMLVERARGVSPRPCRR